MLRCVLVLPLLLCLDANASAEARVDLRNGSSLEAEIVHEVEDAIYIDLGYQLLKVPRLVIERIARSEAGDATAAAAAGEGVLYSVAGTDGDQPIRALVDSIGEAVALVETPTGLGSGFVINKDGFVVTNEHVVAGEHRLSITLFVRDDDAIEKVTYENIRIVAVSAEMDLALLKIEDPIESPLKTVPIGASESLRQGQKVFAIGSPMGLDRTVSEGIISVTNRVIGGRLYLQTTTQINPGNSGGPLLNLRGEVVGVNNMKIAAVGAEGLGFSISSQMLRAFLDNLEAFAFDARNPNAGFRYNRPPGGAAGDRTTPAATP